jgi:hypothetical protein
LRRPDRQREARVLLEQARGLLQAQDPALRAFEFRRDHREKPFVQRTGELREQRGDGQIAFRHDHLDVVEQRAEERPVVRHCAQHILAGFGRRAVRARCRRHTSP